MFTKGEELTMSRDNISSLVMAITVVVSVIVGFTIYFNNSGLNQAWSVQQQQQQPQQQQKDKGLVVGGGVHSPEFQFEKNYTNVKDAVQRFGIRYPVILDSDHGTWNAYGNNYWPRYYLIDTQGYIRYDHIGEGDYNQIEKSIQSLVAERAALMGAKEISFDANPTAPIKPGSLYHIDLRQSTTPEIYIGYSTARTPLGNPEGFKPDQTVSYSIQSNTNLKPDVIYLQGK